MVKSFLSKKFGKMSIAFFAVLTFLAFSGVTAFAQEQALAQNGQTKVNPAINIAQELGVGAGQVDMPGDWKKTVEGRTYLVQQLETMRPNFATLSPGLRFRFEYYQAMVNELGYDVAPEIASLTSLLKGSGAVNGASNKTQVASEYALVRSKFN